VPRPDPADRLHEFVQRRHGPHRSGMARKRSMCPWSGCALHAPHAGWWAHPCSAPVADTTGADRPGAGARGAPTPHARLAAADGGPAICRKCPVRRATAPL
jgi:hypothetical protein